MYDSITTPKKRFGLTMHLVERIMCSSNVLPPFFWSKKQCAPSAFSLDIYRRVPILMQIIGKIAKSYDEQILLDAFNSFNKGQLRKLFELSKWRNNTGKIIATLRFYCDDQLEKQKRLSKPKDTGETKPILYNRPTDLRKILTIKRKTLWEFLRSED